MRIRLLALSATALALACGAPEPDPEETDRATAPADTGTGNADRAEQTADRLALWLSGDYDSADQEAADFNYYGISLRMCRVSLPALGERVLYVEQALLSDLDRPYRQRLYRVLPVDDTTAVSEVWQAVSPGREAGLRGLCDDPDSFEFGAADFEQRDGCAVTLTWNGSSFVGSTTADACLSSLNGATYATAEVTLAPDLLTSWDRGYDSDDRQVWGATAGAYEFVRRSAAPDLD